MVGGLLTCLLDYALSRAGDGFNRRSDDGYGWVLTRICNSSQVLGQARQLEGDLDAPLAACLANNGRHVPSWRTLSCGIPFEKHSVRGREGIASFELVWIFIRPPREHRRTGDFFDSFRLPTSSASRETMIFVYQSAHNFFTLSDLYMPHLLSPLNPTNQKVKPPPTPSPSQSSCPTTSSETPPGPTRASSYSTPHSPLSP